MAASTNSRVSSLSKDVQDLLAANQALVYNAESNKVCCGLSGHEMPCTAKAIHSYVSGKKYNKLLHEAQYDHMRFTQHLVPSTKRGLEHLLFCKLTLRHINNNPVDIDIHVKGRKFQRALARWLRCEKTGEQFKPLTSTQQKTPASSWERSQKRGDKGDNSNSDEDSQDGNDSDLSDLYPEADFASGSEKDEDDIEMESRTEDNDNSDRMLMGGYSDSNSESDSSEGMESSEGKSHGGSSKNMTGSKTEPRDFSIDSKMQQSDLSKRKRPALKSLKHPKSLSGPGKKRKKLS